MEKEMCQENTSQTSSLNKEFYTLQMPAIDKLQFVEEIAT